MRRTPLSWMTKAGLYVASFDTGIVSSNIKSAVLPPDNPPSRKGPQLVGTAINLYSFLCTGQKLNELIEFPKIYVISTKKGHRKMETNELAGMLNGYFGWNKARMKCFAGMLLALIKVRTVNLVEMAGAFGSAAQIDSRYKRLKRFFSQFKMDASCVAFWIMNLFGLLEAPVHLSMDRTNWKWGKSNINILMLSVIYKGIALPIFWQLLPKRGNSDTPERIEIVQRFIKRFGKPMLAGLLADREFIGDDWFGWLIRENIPFGIRIKNNSLTTNSRGLGVNIDALFYDLKPGEQRILTQKRKLWRQKVYLSALRLADGELLIVATDKFLKDPIGYYANRWQIETLFGCLKSKGFGFEETHMTQTERIDKLIVLLAVAFCWAHKTGEWRHEQKAIVIKKHGRKSQSYFRYGLDYLRDVLLNGFYKAADQFFSAVNLLKDSLVVPSGRNI